METPDFCPLQWVTLIVITMFVCGKWFHHIPKGSSIAGVGAFYTAYALAYRDSKSMFLIHPRIYSWVWPILYVMVAIAAFIFIYYDDVCWNGSNNRFHGVDPVLDDDDDTAGPYVPQYVNSLTGQHRCETAFYILFIAAIIFNQMWDTVISYAKCAKGESERTKKEAVSLAAVLACFLTAIEFGLATSLCVVVSVIAASHQSKNLVVSAVFFGLLALWTLIAMVVSISFAKKMSDDVR